MRIVGFSTSHSHVIDTEIPFEGLGASESRQTAVSGRGYASADPGELKQWDKRRCRVFASKNRC